MQQPINVTLEAALAEIRRANGDTVARLTEDLGMARAQLAVVTEERDQARAECAAAVAALEDAHSEERSNDA